MALQTTQALPAADIGLNSSSATPVSATHLTVSQCPLWCDLIWEMTVAVHCHPHSRPLISDGALRINSLDPRTYAPLLLALYLNLKFQFSFHLSHCQQMDESLSSMSFTCTFPSGVRNDLPMGCIWPAESFCLALPRPPKTDLEIQQVSRAVQF